MEDEREVVCDGDTHTGAILQLVFPGALESGGEQVTDGGEHVEIEQREAVGSGCREFVGEAAVSENLGAEGCRSELVTEFG